MSRKKTGILEVFHYFRSSPDNPFSWCWGRPCYGWRDRYLHISSQRRCQCQPSEPARVKNTQEKFAHNLSLSYKIRFYFINGIKQVVQKFFLLTKEVGDNGIMFREAVLCFSVFLNMDIKYQCLKFMLNIQIFKSLHMCILQKCLNTSGNCSKWSNLEKAQDLHEPY